MLVVMRFQLAEPSTRPVSHVLFRPPDVIMAPMQREVAESDSDSDSQLVEECLRGSAEAWEKLVRKHANLVYGVARRYGLDQDDAADVFQNTWSALWERLSEVRDRSRLGPWLITVAARHAYQQHQRQVRRSTRHEYDYDFERQPDPAAQPEDLAIAFDEADRLRRAMERLPERCRELLDYLFYDPEAPSYAEVARRLGVSPDTVGPLRWRCLRQLRALLEEPREL
jgi:RNA polymerase sigma factor (sigma-70 family)